jgi:hypothetical protein
MQERPLAFTIQGIAVIKFNQQALNLWLNFQHKSLITDIFETIW